MVGEQCRKAEPVDSYGRVCLCRLWNNSCMVGALVVEVRGRECVCVLKMAGKGL
jgi:hypothetical protein